MLTGAALPGQTAATADATAPEGLPSMAHYVRKILLVSDNDAYNRLYEFLGHDALNSALRRKGYHNSRIVHRLESGLSESQNRDTNPIRFEHNGTVLYAQDAVQGSLEVRAPGPVLLGKAEVIQGQLVQGPKDFAGKNALPLQDQHDILQALLFPDAVDEHRRFQLQPEDRALVLDAMSGAPADSGIEAYASRRDYPDGFVKFLLFGGEARHIPPHIRVFNKSGQAYGFLTDMAYLVDEENGVEFMLGATLYTNANGVFNDDIYEYEEIGFPFMAALGKAIYRLELDRNIGKAGPE